MSFISIWKEIVVTLFPFKKPSSASLAKERLKIIVSHERGKSDKQIDFLPELQKELINVIAKYIDVDKEQVKVGLERNSERSVLELSAILPEREGKAAVETAE